MNETPGMPRVHCWLDGLATGNACRGDGRSAAADRRLEAGVVTSLSRPGGNTTGFMGTLPSLGGKWLELLKEVAPGVRRVLVLANPDPSNRAHVELIEKFASEFDARVSSSLVQTPEDIARAINEVGHEPKTGLILLPGGPITVHRQLIFDPATRYRLPAVYACDYYAREGGLLAYGPSILDQWRRAASYVSRIFNGEKAGDLPVQAPTKFELAVNLRTAQALGLTVPPTLLARPDG